MAEEWPHNALTSRRQDLESKLGGGSRDLQTAKEPAENAGLANFAVAKYVQVSGTCQFVLGKGGQRQHQTNRSGGARPSRSKSSSSFASSSACAVSFLQSCFVEVAGSKRDDS